MSSSFFCLSPFHSQRLMFAVVSLYGTWTKILVTAQHGLFVVSGRSTACWSLFSFSSSGVFFYFNSALKPILYYVMSKRFRHGFFDTKRKVMNPAEPSRKMTAVRMFQRRDDHPDEILMYTIFSILYCKIDLSVFISECMISPCSDIYNYGHWWGTADTSK